MSKIKYKSYVLPQEIADNYMEILHYCKSLRGDNTIYIEAYNESGFPTLYMGTLQGYQITSALNVHSYEEETQYRHYKITVALKEFKNLIERVTYVSMEPRDAGDAYEADDTDDNK